MPSFLIPEDVVPYMVVTDFITEDNAEQELDIDEVLPWARKNLLASDGAYVRVPESDKIVQIPTLVPASRKNGSCVHFNQKTRLCGVHDQSPFGCRMFSCGMDEKRANALSAFAAARLAKMWDTLCKDVDSLSEDEGLYAAIWLKLEDAGHKRKRSTIALRKVVERAIRKISKEGK